MGRKDRRKRDRESDKTSQFETMVSEFDRNATGGVFFYGKVAAYEKQLGMRCFRESERHHYHLKLINHRRHTKARRRVALTRRRKWSGDYFSGNLSEEKYSSQHVSESDQYQSSRRLTQVFFILTEMSFEQVWALAITVSFDVRKRVQANYLGQYAFQCSDRVSFRIKQFLFIIHSCSKPNIDLRFNESIS